MPTIVYIDGFNLYYGAVKGTPYKWLDLEALCRRLLPKDKIVKIRYFTARISARPNDPDQPARQHAYLRALETLPLVEIHYGHYLSHVVRMPLARPPARGPKTVEVIKTEEKGSDVNLATYLLLDAFRRRCDTAVVISNDSDLAEPILVTERELGVKVGVVNPHPSRCRSRAIQSTFFKQLRRSVLKSCQLPSTIRDQHGVIRKPDGW
ncbi:MAG: hypothetical protein KatS3mg008_0528 [Acidimicrobiales bacterium]|nr:MAG: hypothetical protein KatS3mg008_0528 [Acidimicrobiales bacterium]